MSVRKMSVIAMMSCLITVSSWLTIPSAIPFTMQTFAVFCTLLLLGGKSGLVSIVIYIFMGAVGLPVFAGFQGGISHIVGPTGGYVIGFIFSAVFYLMFESLCSKYRKLRLIVLAGGLIICYLIGTIWFQVVMGMSGTSYSFSTIISICVMPYIIPDLAKLAMAWIISDRIRKEIHNL